MANEMTANPKAVSPAQRASNFAQATRKHEKVMAKQTVNENETAVFTLTKARLLSRVRLLVEATVKVTHATATVYTPAPFAPFNLLRNVAFDMNNGFMPFSVSGRELYMYNMSNYRGNALQRQPSGRSKVVQELKASTTGVSNKIRFVADMPNVLNDRDPIGLIMLQNTENVTTISVDIGKASDILDKTMTGYTVTLESLSIIPLIETFSIPAVADAFPDISILKLVQSTSEQVTATGEKTIALKTGTTYRKLLVYLEDENGQGVSDDAIAGNFELIFNGADIPVTVNPKILAAINHEQFGFPLPDGFYVWDFSYNGIAGLGGARDYIDTERLSQFEFRFNAPVKGKISVVSEMIAVLRG